MILIREYAAAVVRRPHGHVDNMVVDRLAELAAGMTLEELAELNGLVARARYLIENPPFTDDTPPDGGSAAPMALAA